MLSHASPSAIYQMSRLDPAYPARLREIQHPPAFLYIQGTLKPEDMNAVAIVGTRKPGAAAAKLTFALSYELAQRGFTIVSGLALGIDTQAHRGALQAQLGRTLAVLGAGLNAIHPLRNVMLAQQISQRGALLSEYAADTPFAPQHFVARNRLITGLSCALIVMETDLDGGAMYAAEFTRKENRPLFALPGSPGCDALIAHGAHPLDPVNLDLDYLALHIRTYTPPEKSVQMSFDI